MSLSEGSKSQLSLFRKSLGEASERTSSSRRRGTIFGGGGANAAGGSSAAVMVTVQMKGGSLDITLPADAVKSVVAEIEAARLAATDSSNLKAAPLKPELREKPSGGTSSDYESRDTLEHATGASGLWSNLRGAFAEGAWKVGSNS